ncbi:hypothetical protein TNIN_27461 [Trichonephila inaurata madagascariensis]|uniref:Uncharacterized protein n=1 Tax=Trichonephila inaurata madagascariensis TaxID=2747483 RepID=A0A8X7BZA2_9ARAC|nr:hypothetical protein TNIN_27461 [Trichonephila inaurata madagascariensis]
MESGRSVRKIQKGYKKKSQRQPVNSPKWRHRVPIGIVACLFSKFPRTPSPFFWETQKRGGMPNTLGGLQIPVTKNEIPALLPLAFPGVVVVAWRKLEVLWLLLCASPRASAS